MKKCLLLFVLIVFGLPSTAQVDVLIGVKGGLNSANISNSGNSSKSDMYIGGILSVNFLDFYHLQPELVYSRQGYSPDYDGATADNVNLNYLSIMVANKFYVIPNSGFHVIVGPAFDFRVGKSQQSLFDDDLARFDFALFGGIGYKFPFGLTLEGRFKHGFVDIFGRNTNNSVASEDLFANQVFQIGATFHFNVR